MADNGATITIWSKNDALFTKSLIVPVLNGLQVLILNGLHVPVLNGIHVCTNTKWNT